MADRHIARLALYDKPGLTSRPGHRSCHSDAGDNDAHGTAVAGVAGAEERRVNTYSVPELTRALTKRKVTSAEIRVGIYPGVQIFCS